MAGHRLFDIDEGALPTGNASTVVAPLFPTPFAEIPTA